jgi:murein DD-endopeptidase MepM/ murein hydrolase activator NlpD
MAAETQDDAPSLSLPVACEVGKTCFVQNFVDIDPGPEARDFACGAATYDGHKGTDIRLFSTREAKSGVDVIAAANGIVKGTRDGMTDVFASRIGADALKGRECGNGVVVDHGGGWETQYCHMLQGSVAVKSGDKVARGQKLGLVGYSGFANFAHVHFEVRKAGAIIEPFANVSAGGSCLKDTATVSGLWDKATAEKLRYHRGEIITATFAASVPDLDRLEIDANLPAPTRSSPQLVFFARLINLVQGDRIRFSVSGPGGFAVDTTSDPLDRNKATYVGYAGKKLTASAWPAGKYSGLVEVMRDGAVLAQRAGSVQLNE